MTADEMVGWHHLLNGHEFEQLRCIAYGVIHTETVMTYSHIFSKNWYIVCNVKNTLILHSKYF